MLLSYNSLRHQHLRGLLNQYIQATIPAIERAQPTPFHVLIGDTHKDRKLLRNYTQNIDALERKVDGIAPSVKLQTSVCIPKTIQTHGDLSYSQCELCKVITTTDPAQFTEDKIASCSSCTEENRLRAQQDKREHSAGIVIPRIVFYNHPGGGWEPRQIRRVIRRDLGRQPDNLIVAGTRLHIPGTLELVRDIADVVHKQSSGITIWLNRCEPPKTTIGLFDLLILGDADEYARFAQDVRGGYLPSTSPADTQASASASNSYDLSIAVGSMSPLYNRCEPAR